MTAPRPPAELFALLDALHALDVRLTVRDGQLIVDAPTGCLTAELRDALQAHKAALVNAITIDDPATIIPGHVHWNPYITNAELDAGSWGEEFIPGHHYDIRQPSRLKGLCSPP